MSAQNKPTLYDRISAILGRECPALGGVSSEAISVIREMEERLEGAYQYFQDITEIARVGGCIHSVAESGMCVADVVADYQSDATKPEAV